MIKSTPMKLGFVIPLKSKRVSRNWRAVCDCLEATLCSLKNQSSGQWYAVVVGHEKPPLQWESLPDNIEWCSSEHELPPIREGGSFTNHTDFDYILDIRRKISTGMRHLQTKQISYWSLLDADDLVHRDFVLTLDQLPHQAGWLVKSGYLWYQDLQRWMPTEQLINLCGSTAIISSSVFEVPYSNQDTDLHQIPWGRISHSGMEDFLIPYLKGADPTFPLAGIAYTLSHGDNCSDEFRHSYKARIKLWIKKRLLTRALNPAFARDFSINCQCD
ncbi:hypothetical protein EI77_02534 [Prosthecobacter fusiformis]|uniref:Glycosyl transferase family 2 n=1 Tax=Prosthecobacter fusiformis TaxID=48464 RepID=A0A4R7RZK6_9BACT|nr:hypothetical protein [Prosthecobacter fusiformis]TDU71410.1 hypothetical protein EI77_02534 [Prosthecobacter fusiformis]